MMQYDVEADWMLLETCNFRCPYCFFGEEVLGAKRRLYGTPQEWEEGFKSTGKTWLLHITGGEPTIYQGFVDLCERLTQNHYLSINTNLTQNCVMDFAQRINPERIHFINAAIHYEEREKKASLDVFIKYIHELKKANFTVLLSLMMTPHVLSNFKKISSRFNDAGHDVIPKVVRGTYQGRHFPSSYSAEEKRFLEQYTTDAREKHADIIRDMGELPTIDMFSDARFLDGVKDYRGRQCGTGSKFVTIAPDGTVASCKAAEVLGNILAQNVKFLKGPKFCDTWYCPYFCEKYSSAPKQLARVQGEMVKLTCKAQDRLHRFKKESLFWWSSGDER